MHLFCNLVNKALWVSPKSKAGLKFFINTTKPMTKILTDLSQKLNISGLSPLMDLGQGLATDDQCL